MIVNHRALAIDVADFHVRQAGVPRSEWRRVMSRVRGNVKLQISALAQFQVLAYRVVGPQSNTMP